VKNQYFGDINDYRKYGLLRILAAGGKNKIAVCWMLTANDKRTDGKLTTYLTQPERWRSFDPLLFDTLYSTVIEKEDRSVDSLALDDVIPSATFFPSLLADDNREAYFGLFETSVQKDSIVFFDPDNGLEIQSIPKGKRGSSKYLYWDEVSLFFSKGYSLMLYQHFPRIERKRFVTLKAAEILTRTAASIVYSFKTAKVVFFLIPQDHHLRLFSSMVQDMGRVWGREIIPGTHLRAG
jgi:hypothetical protein